MVKSIIKILPALCLIICSYIQNIHAQTGNNSFSGQNKNDSGNDHLLYPQINNGPVVVKAAFHLVDIDQIKDESETFKFKGTLSLKWHDSRQTFDPVTAGVSEKFYQGSYQLNALAPAWYPQVELVNTFGVLERQTVLLRVRPDGTCILIQTMSATAKTIEDLSRYPFDSQSFELFFKVIGYSNREVVFETDSSSITSESQSMRAPQWELTGINASVQEVTTPYLGKENSSSTFVLSLDIKREPFFLLRLVVLPLSLIGILSWSVFWMDKSSLGDRMSVSFVGILTSVSYQVLVSGILPQISDFTLIHAFLSLNFLMMCSTVAINLLVGAYDKRGAKTLSDRLDHICRWAYPLGYACLGLIEVIYFL